MTQALEQRTYTAAEYLELEAASVDGKIRPMTGGTPDHNDNDILIA